MSFGLAAEVADQPPRLAYTDGHEMAIANWKN